MRSLKKEPEHKDMVREIWFLEKIGKIRKKTPEIPVYSKVSGESTYAGNPPACKTRNIPTLVLGDFVRPREKTSGENERRQHQLSCFGGKFLTLPTRTGSPGGYSVCIWSPGVNEPIDSGHHSWERLASLLGASCGLPRGGGSAPRPPHLSLSAQNDHSPPVVLWRCGGSGCCGGAGPKHPWG